MKNIRLLFLICGYHLVMVTQFCSSLSLDDYSKQRNALVEKEVARMTGHDIVLSPDEEIVNNVLKKLRDEELERDFETLEFPPALQFPDIKSKIDKSQVYKFMQRLPKGAVLHTHDIGIVSGRWIISEMTYWEDLYMCTNKDGAFLLRIFETPDNTCQWKLVADERANFASPKDFDDYLFSKIAVMKNEAKNINEAWKKFFEVLGPINELLKYKKAMETYIYRALEEHMNDNVSYMEIRSVMNTLQEKDGKEYDAMDSFQFIEDVINKFTSENSDRFFGARYIYSPPRTVPIETVWEYADLMTRLVKRFPSSIAGFDLPGQEDVGTPLTEFLEPLLTLAAHEPPIQFFFHSGETNWNGMFVDGNLYDAILFNSTRLGHAYALAKHPELVKMAKEKDIAMEVNPISNQFFRLVDDLRNHPIIPLAADSVPFVISSDTPATYDSAPLSHDFYEFFMMMGGNADLKILKKIAFDSVKYSSLGDDQKAKYKKMLEKKWNEFIKQEVVAANKT